MYYLGIDLGTSSVKVLATDDTHRIIGTASKSYTVSYPRDKWAEQNPGDWWSAAAEAVRELLLEFKIPPDGIAAIGFSGQMHGLVALDGNDNVLFPAILWCDQRTEAECEEITEAFGSALLREYTGNKALTGLTAPKILWVKKNRPELFEKIRHILLPKDYLRFCLTGDYATDVSDASGTLLLDVKNRRWSKALCSYLGVEESWLPALYESYEVTGRVSEKAKLTLGLSGDILVVGGAGDQAAGAVGTGTVEAGVVSVTLGTSGVVFTAHDDYAADEECRLHAFCHANGRYHSMGVMLSAASCLQWWAETAPGGADIETLLKEAEEDENRQPLIFLPYLMGERTPYPDPHAKGCFLGLAINTKRAGMTRSVLEGVAFGLRDSLELIEKLEIPIHHVRVIGGGAKSRFWKQILADVFKTELEEISTSEGGALGAAILAGVGAGLYPSVDEGCRKMISVTGTITPSPDSMAYYDTLYKSYRAAYRRLKEWFAELDCGGGAAPS